MNNYEKLRSLNVDELSNKICNWSICAFCIYKFRKRPCYDIPIECKDGIKQWLESEAE